MGVGDRDPLADLYIAVYSRVLFLKSMLFLSGKGCLVEGYVPIYRMANRPCNFLGHYVNKGKTLRRQVIACSLSINKLASLLSNPQHYALILLAFAIAL